MEQVRNTIIIENPSKIVVTDGEKYATVAATSQEGDIIRDTNGNKDELSINEALTTTATLTSTPDTTKSAPFHLLFSKFNVSRINRFNRLQSELNV